MNVLADGFFTNNRATPASVTFSNDVKKKNTRTVTQTNQHQVGYSYTAKVTAEIVSVVKIEASQTLSYQYTHVDTIATAVEEEVDVGWKVENKEVQAGETIYCKASVVSGAYAGDYTSTILITISTGAQFGFKSRGHLDTVGWSSTNSFCNTVEKIPVNGAQLPANTITVE